jgi:hypothetical protein
VDDFEYIIVSALCCLEIQKGSTLTMELKTIASNKTSLDPEENERHHWAN